MSLAGVCSAQGRLDLRPSLAVTEAWDDNLFSSPGRRETDWVTRLRPGLETRYRSAAFRVAGLYALEAEIFREHASLSTPAARQEGTLELEAGRTRGWRLALRQHYLETRSPAELSPAAGLDLARATARRLSSGGALTGRLGDRTEGLLEYLRTQDTLAGARNVTDEISLGFERRRTARTTVTASYTARRFDFPGGDELLHGIRLSGTFDLTPRTRLRVSAGPSVSAASAEAEADASLRRRFRRGEISLAASQARTRLVGQPGAALLRSVQVRFSADPAPWLHLGVVPGVFAARFGGSQVTTVRTGVDATCRLARGLALEAAHEWSLQRGTPGAAVSGVIRHNVATLRLVLAVPDESRGGDEEGEGDRDEAGGREGERDEEERDDAGAEDRP